MTQDPIKKIANNFDIVIIGGGVAGCATAIALKNSHPSLHIAIVERRHAGDIATAEKIGESLPAQAIVPLQRLGLWQKFQRCQRMSNFGTAAAWGEQTIYTNESLFSPYGGGWQIDRSEFDLMLIDAAQSCGVDFYFEQVVKQVIRNEAHWRLVLKNEVTPIHCRFVVDASGSNARFANLLGVKRQVNDKLIGIYRFYQSENNNCRPRNNGSLVESHQFGWWYSANLPNTKLVVGLMTDADIGKQQQFFRKDRWQLILKASVNTYTRLQHSSIASDLKVVAAHSQCLEKCGGAGWLAVGDAAFCFDPLSSLGIFKALRMSIYAGYAIQDYFSNKDPTLAKYRKVTEAEYAAYLSTRNIYYNQEQRFFDDVFWRRRRSQHRQSAAPGLRQFESCN